MKLFIQYFKGHEIGWSAFDTDTKSLAIDWTPDVYEMCQTGRYAIVQTSENPASFRVALEGRSYDEVVADLLTQAGVPWYVATFKRSSARRATMARFDAMDCERRVAQALSGQILGLYEAWFDLPAELRIAVYAAQRTLEDLGW